MRFLFISPLTEFEHRPMNTWVPLGILSLGAALKTAGHEVGFFDRYGLYAGHGFGRGRIDRAMVDRVQAFRPDVVGFQTVSPLIYDTVDCVSLLRPLFSGAMIAGGHHGTALPEATLRRIAGLDGVVAGEGEHALVRFAGGEDPRRIPGFWWKDGDGGIHHTPPVQVKPLDDLPFPDYSLLDGRCYLRKNHRAIRGFFLSSLSMITSRGCVRRCEFCSESLTYGRGVRFHSPRYVAEEVREVLGRYPVDGIYFQDNDFLIDRKRTEEICGHFLAIRRERPFRWSIQARADRIDGDMARLLRKAGCALVEIGVESSLQENLDRLGKEADRETMEEAVARCREAGVAVHAYMITGLEGETFETLEKELAWLKKVRPNSFSWSSLEIHPGTALYERKGNRFFETGEWDRETLLRYYAASPLSPIPREEKRRWIDARYRPFQRRTALRHLFMSNFPRTFLPLLLSKGAREIQRLQDRFQGAGDR
jgi:radical SAM superfamily enzyme YgiQ (UPF0313 family)